MEFKKDIETRIELRLKMLNNEFENSRTSMRNRGNCERKC